MSHLINRYPFASHPENQMCICGCCCDFFDHPIKKRMSTFAGNLSLKCSKSWAQGHRRSKGCSKTPDPSQAAQQSSVRHPHAVTCSFVPIFFFLKYMLISHQPISQVHHKLFFFTCWKTMEQTFSASDGSLW